MKSMEKKIKTISIVSCVGFIIAIVFKILFNNHILFYESAYHFPDYIAVSSILNNVYSGISIGRGYFPFSYVIVKIIRFMFKYMFLGYFITFTIFVLLLICFFDYFFKNLKNKLVYMLLLIVSSYPIIFEFDRANIEYIVLSFLFFFFIFYKKEKYNLAAIFLAFPICMKLYPALFAFLLLKKKKYKEFILCGISSIFLMILSFVIIGGNLENLPIAIENFSFFTEKFAKNVDGIPFTHTLWTFVRYCSIMFGNLSLVDFSAKFIGIYTIIIGIISVLLILYILFIEKEEWKMITILTIMMITFPHVSFDYTLIHMYIPITFFIISESTDKWKEMTMSILLGISIVPMNLIQKVVLGNIYINLGGVLRPLLMMGIIVVIIIDTFNSQKKLKECKNL